jgi:23S rRNA pseudouridine1911/1915/1917 synthase
MVAAKTARALSRLTIHFRRRLVEKRYLALVHGRLSEDEGAIVAPIGRDPERQPHWRVMETGKQAETRFRVVERLSESTLIEMEPVTGRTNQLRIHCAYRGYPIVGDDLYGAVGSNQKAVGSEENISSDDEVTTEAEAIESKNTNEARTAYCLLPTAYCSRLCLHAWRLAFHHPASNEWMEFISPLPQDFATLLDGLRKSS